MQTGFKCGSYQGSMTREKILSYPTFSKAQFALFTNSQGQKNSQVSHTKDPLSQLVFAHRINHDGDNYCQLQLLPNNI